LIAAAAAAGLVPGADAATRGHTVVITGSGHPLRVSPRYVRNGATDGWVPDGCQGLPKIQAKGGAISLSFETPPTLAVVGTPGRTVSSKTANSVTVNGLDYNFIFQHPHRSLRVSIKNPGQVQIAAQYKGMPGSSSYFV